MSARGRAALMAGAALLAAVAIAACGKATSPVTGADSGRGRDLIVRYGCGACHTIGGVRGADATVGPPLTHFKSKRTIVGRLPNRPDQVEHWIEDPQGVVPGNLMPDLGVTPPDARDIASYLYTQ